VEDAIAMALRILKLCLFDGEGNVSDAAAAAVGGNLLQSLSSTEGLLKSLTSIVVKFDYFSVALIYCQLLFQYLDERTDAGFHQQLQAANWNLNGTLRLCIHSFVRLFVVQSTLYLSTIRSFFSIVHSYLSF
jgi:hypothetical protein